MKRADRTVAAIKLVATYLEGHLLSPMQQAELLVTLNAIGANESDGLRQLALAMVLGAMVQDHPHKAEIMEAMNEPI